MALASLYRNPESLEFLKRIDFINLDELGVFSAENLAIFDMIMRYVRGSGQFMGGVFVFCTMDHLQLLPFRGTPILLSMYVITDFKFIRLQESVRAANDPVLRDIIRLTRLTSWAPKDQKLFTTLLENNCIFVDSFEDPKIPNDAVFVFGRKEPCRAAEAILLERMKSLYSGQYRLVDCHDEESTTGGNWHDASEGTKRRLDRIIKQRREVVLYPRARFEFTHVVKNKFNQGQLALLLQVPSDDHIRNKHPLQLHKAPSGVKRFPPDIDCTEESLEANGWVKVKVPFDTTPSEQIGRRLQARRTQYGIKPRVSSTIHACMGATLPAIVTAVVKQQHMPFDFSLWEAAMVVVLLSRTRSADKIFFVGDKKNTIKHLLDVLVNHQHRFLRYITDLLDKLCGERTSVPIIHQPTVFRPKDTIMTSVPGVYLLISTKVPQFTYIGETSSLTERLQTHNSGQGPAATANFGLLPFAMFAYVVGFQHKGERQRFESLWKVTARRQRQLSSTNNGFILIGQDLVRKHNLQNPDAEPLRIVQCGSVTNG
jgi:predicted GIY-YIG superfamily endonuclease